GIAAVDLFDRIRPALNLGNNDACIEALKHQRLRFDRVPDHEEGHGCFLDHVVHVSGPGAVFSRPSMTTCNLALDLNRFESDALQPLAKKYFGQSVRSIHQLGTFNCRPMRGSVQLLSEHGYANAVDAAAFELTDGTEVNVERDWHNEGKRSAFLHELVA